MPRKTVIGIIVIAVVALVTYSAAGIVGGAIVGRAEWPAWRESHILVFFLIWIGSVVVISLPVLWFAGRRLEKSLSAHDQSVAAAKGVGRFAMKALQGDVDATDKLFDLLDDPVLPVRCQSARALAILDKREVDKELFRQVRYWQASDKLALVDSLKSSHDFRVLRLMELLANDRSPIITRRARAALVAVTPRTSRVDNVAASIKAARKPGSSASVGLGEQSVGQRRSVAVKPSAGDQAGAARQTGAATGAAGAAGKPPAKKRVRDAVPSMAPEERASRAAARKEAARGKRAVRAAVAADDQPPLRKKSADVAPRPASGKPAPRPARAARPASGKPAPRPGAPRPAAKSERPGPNPAAKPARPAPKAAKPAGSPPPTEAPDRVPPADASDIAPPADASDIAPPADAPASGGPPEES